jgi:hypothetical protein
MVACERATENGTAIEPSAHASSYGTVSAINGYGVIYKPQDMKVHSTATPHQQQC